VRNPRSEENLIKAYEALRELFETQDRTEDPDTPPFYAPPLPPVDPGSRLSATDLLSWWFRPPSAEKDPWESFFSRFSEPEAGATPTSAGGIPSLSTAKNASAPWESIHRASPKALARAFFPDSEEELTSDDADAAVEVFYEFLHAFGRHDLEGAMRFVSTDYHTFEGDREMNWNDLRNALEALLDSLHGWDFTINLAMVPEAIRHPYGVILYTEIQVDGVHPVSRAKRNMLERRLALLREQPDSVWRISALSPVRLEGK
jgi:hypothetical protein